MHIMPLAGPTKTVFEQGDPVLERLAGFESPSAVTVWHCALMSHVLLSETDLSQP
jgi:hypothetical protein